MKIAICILIALVASGFIKFGVDAYTTIEAGKSPQAVVFGSIPMILIGALAIVGLSNILKHTNEAKETQHSLPENNIGIGSHDQ